jgi:hypothetical protein
MYYVYDAYLCIRPSASRLQNRMHACMHHDTIKMNGVAYSEEETRGTFRIYDKTFQC